MRTNFKHISNTWLVALLFYPFVFYLYEGVIRKVWEIDAELIMFVIAFAFIFSICSYLLCILFFSFLKSTKLSFRLKLYLWIATVIVCVPLGSYFTCGFLGDLLFFFEIKFFLIPGIISALLSVLYHYEQFVLLVRDADLFVQKN